MFIVIIIMVVGPGRLVDECPSGAFSSLALADEQGQCGKTANQNYTDKSGMDCVRYDKLSALSNCLIWSVPGRSIKYYIV